MIKSLIKIFHDPEKDMIIKRYVPTYQETRNLMLIFGICMFLLGAITGMMIAERIVLYEKW